MSSPILLAGQYSLDISEVGHIIGGKLTAAILNPDGGCCATREYDPAHPRSAMVREAMGWLMQNKVDHYCLSCGECVRIGEGKMFCVDCAAKIDQFIPEDMR